MEQKILFIGLGIMGAPMAENIIQKGFDVAVCDIQQNVVDGFKDIASITSTKPSEAADQRNVIMMILPNSDVVNSVLFDEGGALETCAPNSLIVDMSTGSYTKLMETAKRVAKRGHRFIDAPVGRTPREAITGKLLVMAGGETDDIAALDGAFKAVGDTIIHVGETGCGLKAKLVNNYMAMINNAVTGETLSLAKALGLDIGAMAKLMSSTAAGLGQLNTNYPKKVLAGDLTPDFPIFMAVKDLNMAIELAETVSNKAQFGRMARAEFINADKAGMGPLDQTAILEYFISLQ
ncbi:NAD(P)-binding domain-containing protein [Alphaproteobacteria bacterium]|nr:NAD(P)-binding domain-containing protein [Alphaproteobacteria bacterium]